MVLNMPATGEMVNGVCVCVFVCDVLSFTGINLACRENLALGGIMDAVIKVEEFPPGWQSGSSSLELF